MVVLFEGPPDEKLLKVIGVSSTQNSRHKSGVLKKLVKKEGLIGVVDEDPKNTQSRPRIMNEFLLLEEKYAIKVYHHQSNNNRLIVLCPDLENWILSAAKTSRINVSKFKLPNRAGALHDIINSRLLNFGKLIQELIAEQNASILYLQSILMTK